MKNRGKYKIMPGLNFFFSRKSQVIEGKVVNLSPIMATEPFRFRKFQVSHYRSSMRVGTDAALLGAWADVQACNTRPQASILDIGCGCGVISLMAAQRCPRAQVLGIDIDVPSIEEATENALRSPFAGRVRFRVADVRNLAAEPAAESFDLILCNPPYYTEDTLPPDQRRSMARNAVHLSFGALVESVCRLMKEDGTFALVIPMQARDFFVGAALENGLHIRRECRVQTVSRKTPKRVLLEFGFQSGDNSTPTFITLHSPDGGRSQEYSLLCEDFYL